VRTGIALFARPAGGPSPTKSLGKILQIITLTLE